MSLKEQIKNDIKEAMRAKDTARRDTLRNLSAAIKQIEVDERRELSDADVEQVLMKYAKQREDALAQFKEAGRDDLVAKEEAELKIVKSYLPEPMNDEELEQTLKELVEALEAKTMKEMGKVMAKAKEVIGSRAEGSRISQIVKKLLS
ncbi:GatB/YqeY domain-containing protein [Nitratifractor salsuginis]|uniref:GatB/YqeY domain-containing protein n=1 Tax=Nitratifractor salsuginis (strain DSM 16511 / JCM 12458 / E9I37-1) TaxID=749222 RepID=E6X2L4_NITSE|nr:GatB/YqeY domain-containing protein [Nitratifractor salsuginis]ADV46080.1 GatB/YqeY domain-containing protein [Nitratifractor salsuginis DSM 16511]